MSVTGVELSAAYDLVLFVYQHTISKIGVKQL